MGGFSPVYPPEDMDKLDTKQRDELRNAVLKVLQTDPQVRNLLKSKTLPVFKKLVSKKSKKGKKAG
jgi:hypothetical protein